MFQYIETHHQETMPIDFLIIRIYLGLRKEI